MSRQLAYRSGSWNRGEPVRQNRACDFARSGRREDAPGVSTDVMLAGVLPDGNFEPPNRWYLTNASASGESER